MPDKGAAGHKRSPHGKHKECRCRLAQSRLGRRKADKLSQYTSPPSTLVFPALSPPAFLAAGRPNTSARGSSGSLRGRNGNWHCGDAPEPASEFLNSCTLRRVHKIELAYAKVGDILPKCRPFGARERTSPARQSRRDRSQFSDKYAIECRCGAHNAGPGITYGSGPAWTPARGDATQPRL
jgi:hypothetical protein